MANPVTTAVAQAQVAATASSVLAQPCIDDDRGLDGLVRITVHVKLVNRDPDPILVFRSPANAVTYVAVARSLQDLTDKVFVAETAPFLLPTQGDFVSTFTRDSFVELKSTTSHEFDVNFFSPWSRVPRRGFLEPGSYFVSLNVRIWPFSTTSPSEATSVTNSGRIWPQEIISLEPFSLSFRLTAEMPQCN